MISVKYFNTALLLLILIQLCLGIGKRIGNEFLQGDIKQALLKTIFWLAIMVVQWMFFLHIVWKLDREPFYVVVSLYLIAFSRGRSFRRIIGYLTIAYLIVFATAASGRVLGFTSDIVKYMDYGAKHAFGMVHPNTAAHILLFLVMGIWLLFLQKNTAGMYLLFWLSAIVIGIWNRCRTVMGLLIVFPVIVSLATKHDITAKRVWKYLTAAAPFLGLFITLILCIPIDQIHQLTYDTPLFSIGERFVQGGIALRTYGLHLIGQPIDTSRTIKMVVDGVKISLFVMDNAYLSYGIIDGLLWLFPCLAYLGAGNGKAWKNKNTGLLIYGVAMLLFALLERRGLDPVFNLMFYYPMSLYTIQE